MLASTTKLPVYTDIELQSERVPLKLQNSGKTVVIYVFHQYDRNVKFFMRNGLVPHKNVDYIIVQNHPEWKIGKPVEVIYEKTIGDSEVTWVHRHNQANDWGAYSEALKHIEIPHYDYFVFLNSTMRGPFLVPAVAENIQHWAFLFTKRLTSEIAEVGCSINKTPQPHVQSMLMAFDYRGLRLLMKENIFFEQDKPIGKRSLILKHEVGSSQFLLSRGYNIDCVLVAYQGKDWRSKKLNFFPVSPQHYDLWGENRYFGRNIHPFESIFVKTNRDFGKSGHETLEQITQWYEYSEVLPELSSKSNLASLPTYHAADHILDIKDYIASPGENLPMLDVFHESDQAKQKNKEKKQKIERIILYTLLSLFVLLIAGTVAVRMWWTAKTRSLPSTTFRYI